MRGLRGKHICKSLCGHFVLRPFENLRDSRGNLCSSCFLAEPYARSKAQHPNGAVSLIAAHWYTRVFAIEHGLGSFAVGAVAGCGEQDPESVMIKFFESVGEPADLLDD